jgi:hypothetical protein
LSVASLEEFSGVETRRDKRIGSLFSNPVTLYVIFQPVCENAREKQTQVIIGRAKGENIVKGFF